MRSRLHERAAAAALAALGLLILALAGLPQRADYTGQMVEGLGYTAPEPGALAPRFMLPMLDGTDFALANNLDRYVILNFWATWCLPCEAELPILQHVHMTYPQVIVLAVNVAEPAQHVGAWLAERQLSLPVALDLNSQIARQYQLRGQPTTFIIAPGGVVRHVFHGPFSEQHLLATLFPEGLDSP
jgi:thiol-disulfide isomerase/thioredoxin